MKKIATKSFLKIALRQNILFPHPKVKDPYQHANPGMEQDSDGVSYKVREFDEEGAASMGGTEAREGYPRGIQREDDFELQRQRSIPESDHMFIGEHDESMLGVGEGANDQRFTDHRDRIPTDEEIYGPDPPRIQKMQTPKEKRKRSKIFDRIQDRVKGAYYG